MIEVRDQLSPGDLLPALDLMWEQSARSLEHLRQSWSPADPSPVFTRGGIYVSRGWTEWTRGFLFGSALLQFEATGNREFLDWGRRQTLEHLPPHVSHTGVHDHGFNIVSTYGALWRMMREGKLPDDPGDLATCELALRVSGAVQAARWSRTSDGEGFIYSFNGPHSLFCDTLRSLRSLALAYRLSQPLLSENDESVSLLERLLQHARVTARYSVFYGEGRDIYDVPGRVAHESLFNPNDGRYRCPSTQQGYSPFSTWTRGQAWIVLGFAEQLEFVSSLSDDDLKPYGGRAGIEEWMLAAARVAADHVLSESSTDGIPYWDTGAPGLVRLDGYRDCPADPWNDEEPVDSSAAAINAQGLLRLGHWLQERTDQQGTKYFQAGMTILQTLLSDPYLNRDDAHQGLLLHSIYHRPRGWDYVPPGARTPRGESCLWGDYHLREAALLVQRLARGEPWLTFFGSPSGTDASR